MISDKLKVKIISQLKLHLDKKDWQYIDLMFSECYETHINDIDLITLHPTPEMGDLAMQFLKVNGSFMEITSWEYIKKIGELL